MLWDDCITAPGSPAEELNEELKDKTEGLGEMGSELGISDSEDMKFNDLPIYATFDNGVALIGMYTDASKSVEFKALEDGTEASFSKFNVQLTFDGINDDANEQTIPEDVVENAVEKDEEDSDDSLFKGLEGEEEELEESESDSDNDWISSFDDTDDTEDSDDTEDIDLDDSDDDWLYSDSSDSDTFDIGASAN